MSENNKVVIITGASSGIGAATAKRLARDGMKLTLAARREDRLKEVAAEVEALGGEALTVVADVRNNEDIQKIIQATLDRWGRVDVLLNNAGMGNDKALTATKIEKVHLQVQLNLIAVIEFSQAIIPVMLKQKSGHIINVASIAGLVGVPGSTVYCATKFGVNGFSDSLHRELLGTGIKVSAFCPGFTPSEISSDLKVHADGKANAPHIPGLMPVTYVADSIARLIYRPRLRMIVPRSWTILVWLAYFFPGLADVLISWFTPKKKIVNQ